MNASRQPVFYLTHGGGPCFWMDTSAFFGANAFDGLRSYLEGLLAGLSERPRTILMVTAHWEEKVPTLGASKSPSMLYDYYGFPEHTYHLKYPAPGAPDVAAKAQALLQAENIAAATSDTRGFDHGVFVPMMIIDAKAEIPIVMMSLQHDLKPAQHIAIGRALAPLRDEGILIIGSGSSYHNLREFMGSAGQQDSVAFDRWLNETVALPDPAERNKRLIEWEKAPCARACHPREEHLLPLMVAAGAAGQDRGQRTFSDAIGGKAISCFGFGISSSL